MKTTFKLIPIDYLQPGRYQSRRSFDPVGLEELAQSILSQGLIEPIVVRTQVDSQYEIIAGERRWRAAMLAGLLELPCVIRDYTDEQAAAVTLIENIQRQELNLIEEAKGYHQLVQEFHFQQDDLACLVGKSRSHIANVLRLLNLCERVQEKLIKGVLSFGHARALIGLDKFQQRTFAKDVETHGWSVRTLEQKVKATKVFSKNLSTMENNCDVERLQNSLAEQVGAPVQILSNNGGGWLQIRFFDNDTLTGLLERMGLRYDY